MQNLIVGARTDQKMYISMFPFLFNFMDKLRDRKKKHKTNGLFRNIVGK